GELIGGTAPGARNLITGSNGIGIWLLDGGGNTIQGNFIGTDVTGLLPLGAPGEGIAIERGGNNVIGGNALGAGNVIANCFRAQVSLLAGTTGNVIVGNSIGTSAAGTAALGINGVGVLVTTGAHDNQIGGAAAGAGNTIAFSGGAGVAVVDATSIHNSIRG